MTKIIVVDDDKEDQNKIKDIVTPFLFKFNEQIKSLYFNGYTEALEKEIFDNSQRKIYILDIDLKSKITGINIALKIREKDWDSEIIFLTNHDNYFQNVYRNIFKVFSFIEKFDHMQERLEKDLNKILNKNCDNQVFKFRNSQIDVKIYLKDILYIYRETSDRKIIIKTTNNSFKINKTIAEMLEELDSRFKKVHRACIINTDRVNQIDWKSGIIVLDNKEEVNMLSRKFKEEVNL